MKKSLSLLFVLFVALSITSCGVMKVFAETVEGSGEVIVEHRDLPGLQLHRGAWRY